MLKFIRQHADKISGVEIYPLISLIIFVVFFIAVLVYVKRMKPGNIAKMSNMPLDLEEETKSQTA